MSVFITTARSQVYEEANFVPFAGFKYKGNIKLLGSKRDFIYKGLFKLDIKRPHNDWFSFNSREQESKSFTITDEVKIDKFKKEPLSGIYLSKIDKQVYSTLLEYRPERERDEPIFLARGMMTFDPQKKEYIVVPKFKRDSATYIGDEFYYNDAEQKSRFNGIFNFVNGTSIYKLKASGEGQADLLINDFSFDVLMSIDFEAGRQIFDDMPSSFEYEREESPLTDDDYLKVKDHLIDLLSEKEEKTFYETNFDEAINVANYLYNGIVLSHVKLKWSKDKNAFYSVGDLGISNMYRTQLHAKVNGYLEIPKNDNSSTLNLFLITESHIWYYFSFTKNKIFVWSNNEYFNDNTVYKKKQRVLRLAKKGDIQRFVNQFRANYLKIDEELELEFLDVETVSDVEEGDGEETDDEEDDEESDDEEDDEETDDDDSSDDDDGF